MADKTVVFTPYANPRTNMRAYMQLTAADKDKYDALPRLSDKSVVVFDTISQDHYRVKRADCGAGCRCAAVVLGRVQVK